MSQAAGIDPRLVFAVMGTESSGNQNAVSPKGALGRMQLMPKTARELGVDPTNPQQNILGGVEYLRRMLAQFKGNVVLALAAYNAGPGAVTAAHGDLNALPSETQAYVRKIVSKVYGAP